jgi:hypothetical protein
VIVPRSNMTNNDKKQIKYTQISSSDNDQGHTEKEIFKEERDFDSAGIQFNDTSSSLSTAKSDSEKSFVWNVLLLLCFFVLSIGLTFYQRWLLKVNIELKTNLLRSART